MAIGSQPTPAQKAFRIGYRLFRKSVSSEHSNFALGYLWKFAEPISLAVIFSLLRSGNIINVTESAYPFFLHLITGLFPFQLFFNHLQQTNNVIQVNATLLGQTQIPPLSLAVLSYCRWLFDSIFAGIVISVACLAFASSHFGGVILSFIWLQAFGVLAVGIGLACAPINTILQDTSKLIALAIRPLMFLSPIFYASSDSAALNAFNRYNPIALFLDTYRSLALDPTSFSLGATASFLATTVALAAFGLWFFCRALPCLNVKS